MDKQKLLEKTVTVLHPFETANVMNTVQNLTLKQILTHPLALATILVLLFFGVIKRSQSILLLLFILTALIAMVHFAMPASNASLSFSTTLPFIGGGLVIGCVIIYFTLIKS